jgi:hypothetical protein
MNEPNTSIAAVRKCIAATCAVAATIGLASNASAQDAAYRPSTVSTFSGVDFAPDSRTTYAGIVVSLQGNLDKSGFVFRAYGGNGDYDYRSDGTKFDGDDVDLDAGIGYLFVTTRFTAAVYAAVNYRDIDITPFDPTNDVQGDETGFRVIGELDSSEEDPFYYSFGGAYSTAFDSWYAMLRLGYNAKRFAFGPEGLVSGEEGDETQRLGGFVTYRFDLIPTVPAQVTAYGGKQFVEDDDGDGEGFTSSGGEGAYGGVSFSLSY